MDRLEYLEHLEGLFSKTIVVMAKRKDFGERFTQLMKILYENFLEAEELRDSNDQPNSKKVYLERLRDHMQVALALTLTQQNNSDKFNPILKILSGIDKELNEYNLDNEEACSTNLN